MLLRDAQRRVNRATADGRLAREVQHRQRAPRGQGGQPLALRLNDQLGRISELFNYWSRAARSAKYAATRSLTSAAGGASLKVGMSPKCGCQPLALESHTSHEGSKSDGSSKLATCKNFTRGASGRAIATGEPHSPQKRRRIVRPAAEVTLYERSSLPVKWSRSAGTMTVAANADPLARWQSRQWQTSCTIGRSLHVYRTARQAQPPEMVVVMICSLARLLECAAKVARVVRPNENRNRRARARTSFE